MIKAQITLVAIVLFALVGAAGAINTSRSLKIWYSASLAGNCTVPVATSYTTILNDAKTTDTYIISTINTFSHIGTCTTNITIAYPAF